ncbi:hypothetical protein OG948_23165 [Embleya sp. NBC_00888]|uniref:hypothetical protein n=1 Tax=Embleya sp. NBC_00888 TaxID=2975960 RepID=UPI00386BFE5E|nr:hypothetical protein OG948_23165 [Embleya sp. NBC_00888]
MGVREGESRMTMRVYRLYPNGEREDIKPREDFELGDASRSLPQLRNGEQSELPMPWPKPY